jgi:hypothetical protein
MCDDYLEKRGIDLWMHFSTLLIACLIGQSGADTFERRIRLHGSRQDGLSTVPATVQVVGDPRKAHGRV